MLGDADVLQFEEACAQFRHPSTRVAAEQYLLAVRRSDDAVTHGKFFLERSQKPFAQFQAATILRDASLRCWTRRTLDDWSSLCTVLLELVVARRETMQRFVRQQILQTTCVLYKRSWTKASAEYRRVIFTHIQHLSTLDNTFKMIAMDLLLLLVTEFVSNKSSVVGLPLEFHRETRAAFEADGLMDCFAYVLQLLRENVNCNIDSSNAESMRSLKSQLDLVTQILEYDFDGTSFNNFLNCSDETDEVTITSIHVPLRWRDAFLNSGLSELLLDIYDKLRTNTNILRFPVVLMSSRNSLVQLSSITGKIFADNAARLQFVSPILSKVMHIVSEPIVDISNLTNIPSGSSVEDIAENAGSEKNMLCKIICRIIAVHGLNVLLKLPASSSFFQQLTQITIQNIQSSVSLLATETTNSTMYEETLCTWLLDIFFLKYFSKIHTIDELILCWLLLVNTNESNSPNSYSILVPCCNRIFRSFVECRQMINSAVNRDENNQYFSIRQGSVISTPSQIEEVESLDINELSDGYADVFALNEIIFAIVQLGRYSGVHGIQWLRNTLQSKSIEMLNNTSHQVTTNTTATRRENHMLLSESVVSCRWFIKVLGILLGDDSPGETNVIPAVFMKDNETERVVVEAITTLEDLVKADLNRLLVGWREGDIGREFIGLTLEILLAWRRVILSYLIPDASIYHILNNSSILLMTYSLEGKGKDVLLLILRYSFTVLSLFAAQEQLANAAVDVISALASTKGTSALLCTLPEWRMILIECGRIVTNDMNNIPTQNILHGITELRGAEISIHFTFTKALCQGCQGSLLCEVTKSVEGRLAQAAAQAMHQSDQIIDFHHQNSKTTLRIMNELRGIVHAVRKETRDFINELCIRSFQPALHLLMFHRARGDGCIAVLKFIRDVAESLIPFMSSDSIIHLHSVMKDASAMLCQHQGRWAQDASTGDLDDVCFIFFLQKNRIYFSYGILYLTIFF